MTMAGKVVLATCLGVLASMGASFVCVAPLQARGSLVKSGWLSSGRVIAATSPRREVSLQAIRTRTDSTWYVVPATPHKKTLWFTRRQHLSRWLSTLRNQKACE